MRGLPDYDHLPAVAGMPPGSAWGIWGEDDSRGTINTLEPQDVLRGVHEVKDGHVFSLNWDIEMPNPPFFGRQPMIQHIFPLNPNAFDDRYDNFYPQGSSQWDALSHVRHPTYGYYNGRSGEEFTGRPGAPCGVDAWAGGIVTRGVLLDIPRHFDAVGRHYAANSKTDIEVSDLAGAAASQGTMIEPGDVVLVRTGWIEWYRDHTDQADRDALADPSSGRLTIAGLSGDPQLPKYLWDSGVVAIATDNPTFESWPRQMRVGDYQHFELLALLGMPIGELFMLDQLADRCAATGRYSFLFSSAPLNKAGGIGSPPNALATT
ncbi:MAG: cyclase family protein [Bifidobacteriaceae bacterium]|jgi:kynurenine formamidase|nr:cyclase family protein [Bifidobacteriaceae bacterium]